MSVAADEPGPISAPRSRAQADSAAGSDATVSVGMAIGLGALAMTFAAVLLAYAIVRVQAPAWPPPGEPSPPSAWPWPGAATVVALAGSAAMVRARRARAGWSTFALDAPPDAAGARRLTRALGATVVAGIVFLAIQASGWAWLARGGFRPDSGMVASVVYALTVFHALHALAAVLVAAPVLVRALRRQPVSPSSLAAVASFWHLVTAAWVVVFAAVFVV